MGTCFTQVDPQDEEAYQFTQLNGEEGRKPRRCTDTYFTFFMAFFFVIVVGGLMIYTGTIGDTDRILRGYDDCGNICGVDNKIEGFDDKCVGMDMTNKPFFLVKEEHKQCVEKCPYSYEVVLHRCVSFRGEDKEIRAFWMQIVEDLSLSANRLIAMPFITIGLIIMVIFLLKYCTEAFLWSLLIGGSAAFIVGTIALWVAMARATDTEHQSVYMCWAIVMTVYTVIIVVVLLVLRKRIKMVIQLFKEASKAISDMPLIMLQPFLTIASFLLTNWAFFCLTIVIGSAGVLRSMGLHKYEYLPTDAVVAAGTVLMAAFVWLLYFFMGCQHMIVGGTTAAWYFTRDKSMLRAPIYNSWYNLMRYHLGTVAFGSLVMVIMQMIRMIIEGIKRKMRESGCGLCIECFSCIFNVLEAFVQYFTRLAYIMTAMHGVTFCRGGKEAFRLLVNNGMRVLCLNSVGSFLLFNVAVFIVVITVAIGYPILDQEGLNSIAIPLVVAGICALFLAEYFLSVYNTVLDTIFLCFCEDMEQNDGMARPYFMSKELMVFVENSKKALAHLEEKENARSQPWGMTVLRPPAANAPAVPA